MKQKKYITPVFVVLVVLTTLLSSCDSSVQFVPGKTDTAPMWPQQGYSARRTGNPFGPKQYIAPVNGTNIKWIDSLFHGINAVYPAVDSKGNIYYLHVHPDEMTTTLFKINSLGNIIWQLTDNSILPSFGNGLGISADEKSIYIPCFSGLFCVDSSGVIKWKYLDYSFYSNVTMPAIGEDGTIYSVIGPYDLQAISPDGQLKWKVSHATGSPSLDKDGNIYVGWTDGQVGGHNNGIAKYDKSGNMKWRYALIKPPFGISIDANNNIYCQMGNTDETGLLSLTKDGSLRWKHFFTYTDSVNYIFWVTPIIAKDNLIYASGSWNEQNILWRGIVKLDTLGNELMKFPIGTNGDFEPIDELFFDSDENIYFRSEYEYGSINQNGSIRFKESKRVLNFTLSINGSLIFMVYDENSSPMVMIK